MKLQPVVAACSHTQVKDGRVSVGLSVWLPVVGLPCKPCNTHSCRVLATMPVQVSFNITRPSTRNIGFDMLKPHDYAIIDVVVKHTVGFPPHVCLFDTVASRVDCPCARLRCGLPLCVVMPVLLSIPYSPSMGPYKPHPKVRRRHARWTHNCVRQL